MILKKVISYLLVFVMLAGVLVGVVSQNIERAPSGTAHMDGIQSDTSKEFDNPQPKNIGPLGSTYDYVIITTNDIVANSERLGNFVYFKELIGHNVKIVTEDDYDVLTGSPPNGRAEKIKQWLVDNNPTMGIEYVLLIGDPDPDDPKDPVDTVGDLPMAMCYPNYFSPPSEGIPTDYIFADLDGDWNLDNDNYCGEVFDVNNPITPDPMHINSDYFSVRWTGFVQFDFTEEYEFEIFSDGGVQFWLDGSLIMDDWDPLTEHLPMSNKSKQPMTAGLHTIKIEYKEHTGDGIIKLWWRTTAPEGDPNYLKKEIIPLSHLFNETATSNGLTGRYFNNIYLVDPPDLVNYDNEVIDFIWGTGDIGTGGFNTEAEVYVGRIPVYDDNYTNLDKILGKIIWYETDPGDISWRKTILLPMQPLWDDTPAWHLGEGIRNDFALGAGFTAFRIYDEDYAPSGGPTPELWPTNVSNVKGEWIKGYGMVVYDTHGDPVSAVDVFHSNYAPELDDTKPGIVYMVACSNGNPEHHNNLATAVLKNGGIATLGATRGSIGQHGAWTFNPNSAINHNLAYFFSRKIIVDDKPVGKALYLTKKDVPQIGTNMLNYNIYGDPETQLMTTYPNYPPVADANGPYSVDEGTAVTFDGTGSYDPEGDPLEYRWDLDGDGEWDTPWSSDPNATFTWGDDYTGDVKLEVRDLLGLKGEDSTTITVNNVAPHINEVKAYIKVNFTLRVAGEKWHNVELFVYEDGTQIGYIEVVRYPGSPDDQAVTITLLCDVTKQITVKVLYTPPDDPINGMPNGANPGWVNLSFEDGGYNLLHHTFNVKHTHTWEWNFGVNQFFVGHEITFEADASDVGSDDLTFTWYWDDGTNNTETTYYNDQGNYPLPDVGSPDPYPSPGGTYPFSAADKQGHIFTSSGNYNVTLTVTDDDGLMELLVVIIIIS